MPPSFRRSSNIKRNPNTLFKFIAAVSVLLLYFLFHTFKGPQVQILRRVPPTGEKIQWEHFKNGTGSADEERLEQIVEAMKFTFLNYKKHAWGYDDIMPVTGGHKNSRNGWGAFLVDAASTLAVMGLKEELQRTVEYIIDDIDFETADDVVDPFETTIRYVGGLASLVDLLDANILPNATTTEDQRDKVLIQAMKLATKLGPAYDSPSGLMWPRVDFTEDKGVAYSEAKQEGKADGRSTVGPARAGSNILENRVLTRLTGNTVYLYNATRAWSPLVWSQYIPPLSGMVDAPFDVVTGKPTGRQHHWDSGHDSYYEYLLKAVILAPKDRYSSKYQETWEAAALSLRDYLTSRNKPTEKHQMQHLFMSKRDGSMLLNEQSHLSCFAPGNLLLGGAYLSKEAYTTLGKALLEACHHTYESSPTKLGPEIWSWYPKFVKTSDPEFAPQTNRQSKEVEGHGFWTIDPTYKLRPEFIESLFYAWRITGEERYRNWAWDVFLAIEKHCKTKHGYAGLTDVRNADDSTDTDAQMYHIDHTESFWAAETLKYLYLIFADHDVISLDRWVFNTEGHPFRMIR